MTQFGLGRNFPAVIKERIWVEPHDIGRENGRILNANGLINIVLWSHFTVSQADHGITDLRNRPLRPKNGTNVYQHHEVLPNFPIYLFEHLKKPGENVAAAVQETICKGYS